MELSFIHMNLKSFEIYHPVMYKQKDDEMNSEEGMFFCPEKLNENDLV